MSPACLSAPPQVLKATMSLICTNQSSLACTLPSSFRRSAVVWFNATICFRRCYYYILPLWFNGTAHTLGCSMAACKYFDSTTMSRVPRWASMVGVS